MADERLRPEDFKKIGVEAAATLTSLEDISKVVIDTAKTMANITSDSAKGFSTSFNAAKRLGKELQGISEEDLKNRNAGAKLQSKVEATEKEILSNKRKIFALELRLASARGKEKVVLKKLIRDYQNGVEASQATVDNTKALFKELKNIDKNVKLFDDLADLVGDVPVLSKLFKEFGRAAKAARAAEAKGKSGFVAGLKELGSGAAKAGGAFGIGLIFKGFKSVNEQTTLLARNLNITRERALELRNTFDSNRFSIRQLLQATDSVNTSLGTQGAVSNETAETMAIMTERLGLSADASARLFNLSAATNQSTKELANGLAGQVMALNASEKTAVDYKRVMEDVAESSAAIALSVEKFPGGIAKAAFNARKFGLTLSQLDGIAESLLNFEESIGNELEAELLMGRELNLERARMFALTNNMAGLQSELAKQGITAAKFAKMSRIEQDAAAKALGMTREELAESLVKQEAIKKLTKETGIANLTNMDTEQRIAALKEKGMSEVEALRALGEEDLARQKENMSMQESMTLAMERMADTVGKLGDPLNTIATVMKGIADFAGIALGALTALAALRFGNILRLGGVTRSLGKGGMLNTKGPKASNIVKDPRLTTGYRDMTTGRTVSKAAGDAAMKTTAKAGGKGIMGRVFGWIGKNAKSVLKIGAISAILETLFAKGDIEAMVASATNKQDLYKAVGIRAMEAVGSVGGSAIGGALGSMIPIPGVGTFLGFMAGEFLGRKVAGLLTEALGGEGIGKSVLNMFPKAKAAANEANPELALAQGALVTRPTRALVGEAGAEGVFPLTAFYAKFDELIAAVNAGGNVYINGNEAGKALALGTYQSSTS